MFDAGILQFSVVLIVALGVLALFAICARRDWTVIAGLVFVLLLGLLGRTVVSYQAAQTDVDLIVDGFAMFGAIALAALAALGWGLGRFLKRRASR